MKAEGAALKSETVNRQNTHDYEQKKAEFRERTKRYASAVVRLYCSLPRNRTEVQVLGRQLLRSGTSVAANYSACEIRV